MPNNLTTQANARESTTGQAQYAAKANKTKKKFSYKKKAQPFTLRAVTQNQEPEPPVKKHVTVTQRRPIEVKKTKEAVSIKEPEPHLNGDTRTNGLPDDHASENIKDLLKKSEKESSSQTKSQKVPNKETRTKSSGDKSDKKDAEKSDKIKTTNPTVNVHKADNKRTRNNVNDKSKLKGQKVNGGQATVTLTQTQLNAILETIGKVSNGTVDPVRISIDKDNQDIKVEKVGHSQKGADSNTQDKKQTAEPDSNNVYDKTSNDDSNKNSDKTESVLGLLNKGPSKNDEKSSKQSSKPNAGSEKKGGVYDLLNNAAPSAVHVEPTSIPGLDLGNDDNEVSQNTDNKTSASTQQVTNTTRQVPNANESSNVNDVTIPKAPLTKGELKRLQWEREKAENEKVQQQVQTRSNVNPNLNKNVDVNPKPSVPSVQQSSSNPPLSKSELKRLQWEKEREEQQQRNVAVRTSHNFEQNAIVNDNFVTSPRVATESRLEGGGATMSKAELKRLQWDKEKAELRDVEKNARDPWGKPGAGAPIRSDSGRVLTDYTSRLEQVLRMSQEKPKDTSGPVAVSSQNQVAPAITKTNQSIATANTNVPAAMRSNFVIGGGTEDGGLSNKEIERRRWLEDLEKQKEEKRMRKMEEKNYATSGQDTWADRMGGYKPAAIPEQPSVVKDDLATVAGGGVSVLDGRASSAPQGPNDIGSSHLRGKITNLDSSTQKELEEQRRRHLEHQKAIQQQVEEHQRQKREERERKIKEEAEEERKLQQERDMMKLQFELEQEKAKKKEQREEQRIQALKEAMDRAKEEAARDKMERRLQRLQKAGHDVSHLRVSMEEELSPRHPPGVTAQTGFTHIEPTHVPGLDLSPRLSQQQGASQSVHVAHTSVPGLNLTPRNEPYTENRMLTPTQYRPATKLAGPTSPMREFGTQTDHGEVNVFQFSNITNGNREETSVEIEYNAKPKIKPKGSKVNNKTNKQKAVVIKEEEEPATKTKRKMTINERPSWGVKQKKPVKKMSERDPNYERKRQEREQRLLERAAKMKELQDRNAAKLAASRKPKRAKSQISETEVENVPPRAVSPPIPTLRKAEGGHGLSVLGGTPREQQNGGQTQRTHRSVAPNDPPRYVPSSNRQNGDLTQRTHRGDVSERGQHRSPRKSPSPLRNATRSPPVPAVHTRMQTGGHSRATPRSPPIPTHQHKPGTKPSYTNDYSMGQYDYNTHDHASNDNHNNSPHSPVHNSASRAEATEFIPFMRSDVVLDPSHAESPVPVSRESSGRERARMAYYQTHEPASYGKHLENYRDEHYGHMVPPESKDPILNPRLVTEHPTSRQGIILKQLSEMRKGLLQRQREIESCLSPSELTASRIIQEDDYL